MAILNYTTQISVDKTLGEIQSMLARAGAHSIKTDYEAGNPVKIAFLLKTAYGVQAFALPANIDAVYKVMERQNAAGKMRASFVNREQAARVGWRIIKDWLEAQLAIIETDMVTLDQVMFPYLLDSNERPLYELYVERQLALPSGEGKGKKEPRGE
jgi:hypothetical protein